MLAEKARYHRAKLFQSRDGEELKSEESDDAEEVGIDEEDDFTTSDIPSEGDDLESPSGFQIATEMNQNQMKTGDVEETYQMGISSDDHA